MNKGLKWVLLAVIALVLFYLWDPTVFGLLAEQEQGPAKAGTASRGPVQIPVNGQIISPRILEDKITITGSVRANEFVEVRSEVAGVITGIFFEEGSPVKKGQVLARIKDEELQAQLKKLEYQRVLFEQTEVRQQQLLDKSAISQEEYDQALSTLNANEADIELVKAQLAKTAIRAPFSGLLGLRNVSEGAYIGSGDVITSLYNVDRVKIDFAVPGKYGNQVRKGDQVLFSTETVTGYREGKVYAIEPRIDENTRTLQVRAICDNQTGELLPGQFASIRLILNTIEDALLVPTEAVIPELGGHKVFLNRGSSVESVPVKIGIRTDKSIEILEGLKAGDTVITTGILQIRPGSEVKVNLVQSAP